MAGSKSAGDKTAQQLINALFQNCKALLENDNPSSGGAQKTAAGPTPRNRLDRRIQLEDLIQKVENMLVRKKYIF